MRQGWEAVYVPDSMGRGVMPDDFAAYRKQRHRWAFGAVQIVKGHWRALLNPFDRSLTQGTAGWAALGAPTTTGTTDAEATR